MGKASFGGLHELTLRGERLPGGKRIIGCSGTDRRVVSSRKRPIAIWFNAGIAMPVDNAVIGDGAQAGSRAIRIVPVIVLCTLALAVAINGARGKNNQSSNGTIQAIDSIQALRDCHLHGIPYWLVPNPEFHEVAPMPSTADLQHIDRLDRLHHAAWKVRVRGNLSPIGRYGFQNRYWREFDVRSVIDATSLNCEDEEVGKVP